MGIIISDDISEALLEGRVDEEILRRAKERKAYKEGWAKYNAKRKSKNKRIKDKIVDLKKVK